MHQLEYKTMEDFCSMPIQYIETYGGKALFERVFEGSLSKVLQSVYPNYNWFPWKFEQSVPKGFGTIDNRKHFMDWLGIELGFRQLDDWYNVQRKDIINNGGRFLLFTTFNF